MAQTMNYLSENIICWSMRFWKKRLRLPRHITMNFRRRSKRLRKRMAEIAVLRTHIVNYAKTREVYVAYRKAGYSQEIPGGT